MILKNKIVIGTLVQFYEMEMLPELLESYTKMLENIENKENVYFHFCFSTQEFLEEIDWDYFGKKYPNIQWSQNKETGKVRHLNNSFEQLTGIDGIYPAHLVYNFRHNSGDFYNIAKYRRELCHNWCEKVDIIVFGESDTLLGSKSLELIDYLHENVKNVTPKYVANFAGRLNWDDSWTKITHPNFRNVKYEETDEFIFGNIASEKSYMTYAQMEEINNISLEEIQVVSFDNPKADGAGLIISSDLIRSGVNIPLNLIHNGEDESLLQVAKKLMGNQFVQYHFENYLRVHNRRHPKKRTGVLNENNPIGKCSAKDKGLWWDILEKNSKHNLNTLFQQVPSVQLKEVLNEIERLDN